MRKKSVLSAILLIVFITTFVAPTTAQVSFPPPPTMPLTVVSTDHTAPVTDKATGSVPLHPVQPTPNPGVTLAHRLPPTPEDLARYQVEESVRAAMKALMYKDLIASDIDNLRLTEFVVYGDEGYGIIEGFGTEPIPFRTYLQRDGSWGNPHFDFIGVGPSSPDNEIQSIGILAQPPTPPRFLTLPFDAQSGALGLTNVPRQGWWYNIWNGVPQDVPPDPNNYQNANHKAIDYWRGDKGSFTILAAAEGGARRGNSTTWGTYVYIRHVVSGSVWYTLYAHLDECYIPNDGQEHPVSRGEPIGTAGISGAANGIIHLHFEVSKDWIGGQNRIDPYGVYGSNQHYYPYPFPGQTQAWINTPPSYPDGASSCPVPSLSSPAPDFVSPGDTITFVWTHPGNCSGQNGYILRVGTSPGGSDVVSGHTSLGLQTNYTFGSQWYNRDLYWSVRANASNATWSESRHFRIEPNQGGGDTVVIWSEAGFTGDRYGWHDPCTAPECGNLPNWLNTRVSSIEIAPGWSVRVYEGDGQSGGQRCYNDSDSNFDGDTFDNGHAVNDHVRSVAIYHQEQCPSLPQPPSTPSLVAPANGSSYAYNTPITLDWQSSSGATEYIAHLWSASGYDLYSNWIAATEWSVGQLSPATYHWQVRARNQYGESPYSSEWTFTIQQGAPNAPSNLSASAVSQSQINLTWTDNSSNETGFRLYREGLLAATLGAGTTSYQDTNLECGRGYNYYVVAFNDAGQSGHSNTASATTQACPPTAPPAPNPVSPANGATFNCQDTLMLVWDNLGASVEYYIETWGANSATYGWQTGNTRYLGQQQGGQTWWRVRARYVGQTAQSNWGNTFSFNVNSCPQYPDLRPYAPAGYQYPVVPSAVQNTRNESILFVGQATYFDWYFINEGTATANGDFHVELWVDSTRYMRYPFSYFAAGSIAGFNDWAENISTPGWHTVRLITDPDGTINESNETNNEWSRSFYWHVPCADPYESNNQPATATGIQYGDTVMGADICPRGEYDYYAFYGFAGDTIVADIDARVIGSQLDSVLTLFDSDGTTILAENDDYDWLDSRIRYTLSHNGTYYLRVRDYGDNDGGGDHFYQLSLSGAASAPYYNDFESSIAGWETQGLWHLVNEYSPYPEASSGTHSWWYGQDSTGDYDTGAANSGSLTSPALYIPSSGYYLRFNYWYVTETQGVDYDRRCVQVSVDSGPYTTIYCLSDDGMGWWHSSPALDLSAYADHIVRVRFHFDTVDQYYNGFRGWYVDDVSITNTPPPNCSDSNEPNDTPATATTIAYGGTRVGQICPPGDRDFFAFTGVAGDTIIADIDARVNGSSLDSILTLLASDGVTELATNDDAGGSLDSLVGYTLPESGVYYLKVRDYSHPSSGSANHYYALSLYVDNSPPTGAFLAPTSGAYITSTGEIPIVAGASDIGSGVRNVVFLWHSGDWSNPNWEVLGEDWYGGDGWSINWDVGSLPDQRDAALYAWAFDWGSNWVGMECWGLTLDRESPTSTVETYAAYGGASFRDFWLRWYGEDAASGIATYDIQYRVGTTGTWTDLITNTTATYARVVAADGYTYYFRSRARDYAGNVGVYPDTPQSSYTVQVCPIAADIWESNDTPATAKAISIKGDPQSHNFHVEEDQDWAKFTAVRGQSYTIETSNVGGYADTVLYLYGPDGSTLLDFNDDFEGLGWSSRITWTAPANGIYYIKVVHWDPFAYGCSTAYTLAVSQGHKAFLPLVLRP